MIRIAIALSLAGCLFGWTALASVEPGLQEKVGVQEPPAKEVKQEVQKKSVKEPLPNGGDKKDGEVKGAVLIKVAPPMVKQAKPVAGVKVAAPAAFAVPVQWDANFAFQQVLPQVKGIHKAELHFMRMVCQPTREQFEKVAADSEPALRASAEKLAALNQNGMMIVRAGRGVPEGDDQLDLPRQIADAVSKSVRKVLSVEQANRYDKELAERLEASNRVVVRGFVIKMDRLLRLSSEQREAITKLLNSKWKYSASRARMLTLGGDQYFPSMPDSEINQILTEAQKQVWSRVLNKGNISFGVAIEAPVQVDFEEIWDEPAQKTVPPSKGPDGKRGGSEKKEQR